MLKCENYWKHITTSSGKHFTTTTKYHCKSILSIERIFSRIFITQNYSDVVEASLPSVHALHTWYYMSFVREIVELVEKCGWLQKSIEWKILVASYIIMKNEEENGKILFLVFFIPFFCVFFARNFEKRFEASLDVTLYMSNVVQLKKDGNFFFFFFFAFPFASWKSNF